MLLISEAIPPSVIASSALAASALIAKSTG
jgi:hypothetical protein